MSLVQSSKLSLRIFCALVALLPVAGRSEEEPILRFASAIEKGDLEAVQKLLASGLDPNTRVPGSNLGYTPLFLSVQANQPTITSALLKAGAKPSVEDENGDPVMVHAADKDHLPQARLLIAHGISIDSRNRSGITALMRGAPYENGPDIQAKVDLGADLNLTDPDGNTALMLAAKSTNLAALEVLIKAGAKLDLRDKEGQTALMLVLTGYSADDESHKTRDAVKLLVAGGADINIRDPKGRSALILALDAWSVKSEAIEVLLAANPDVGFRDEDGRDALFHAVLKDSRKGLVKRLLELGADVKTTDNEGADLLMLAASNCDLAQVQEMIDRGLSPDRKTKSGATAIHYLSTTGPRLADPFGGSELDTRGNFEVLKLLHQHGGSLTAADADGNTPLHLASLAGSSALVAYLLPNYPDPAVSNLKGESPLHYAASSGSTQVLDLLIPKYPAADVRDADGRTPLMDAMNGYHREAFLQLQKAGAEVNATDKSGNSALSDAIADDQIDKARFLVEHGADPKSLRDPGGKLLRAARLFHDRTISPDGYSFLVELFAGLTADINRRDTDGMTALMWVAASDNHAALKAILKHHPDLQARSPDGRTALMWAAGSHAVASMQTLRAAGADGSLRDPTGRIADDWLAWSSAETPRNANVTPAGESSLLERLTRRWTAELQSYLEQGAWSGDDRIAGTSPLHLAAALGDTGAIETLIKKGAPPNQTIADQSTPLMEAASNGRIKAIEVLLAQGADPALRNANRERAIDRAVYLGHFDVARLLLRRKDSLSTEESSLLVILVQRGDKELLRDFLKAGASIPPPGQRVDGGDPFGSRTTSSDAPLLAAAAHADPALLRTFFEFATATGADDPDFAISALHCAADVGHLANVRILVEDRKVDPDVLLSGAFGGVTRLSSSEPDGKGEKPIEGFSALSRALENGHDEVVRYLVRQGADITGRTRSGSPPLNFVIEHHQPEMLRLFLENKAPTRLVGFNGQTALHVAAASDDDASIRLLLEHGADPNVKSSNGQTPLDLARKNDAKKAAAFLEAPAK